MAKVDGTYESLLQGISQQPPRDRQPGQAAKQLNCMSKPVDGLTDRPPLVLVERLGDSIPDDAKWHHYSRGDTEKYFIAVHGYNTWIFDWEGNPIELRETEGMTSDYLDATSNRDNLYMQTIGDYTAIVNQNTVVEAIVGSEETNAFGIVHIRAMGFGLQVTITTDRGVATVRVADGSIRQDGYTIPASSNGDMPSYSVPANDASRADARMLEPQFIAALLYTVMGPTGSTLPPEYSEIDLSLIYYTFTGTRYTADEIKRNGSMLMIATSTLSIDGAGSGPNIVGVLDSVREVGHLPPKSFEGHTVKVGRSSEGEDAYYLKYQSNTDPNYTGFSDSDGTWVEARKLGISPGLEPSTMPHAFISRYDSGLETYYFTFEPIPWAERKVGDDDSNPLPKFVGREIIGLGQFHDRLYMYSGEDIHFSRTTLYEDLFIGSAASSADDDGFDVTSATNQIQNIRAVVANNQALIAFTDNSQFVMDGSTAVTPSNAFLSLSTAFDGNLGIEPIANGNVIYFAYEAGAYTGIKEFFTDSIVDTNDARAITSHVERYIPGNDCDLLASNQENIMLVHPHNASDVYVYQYLFDEQRQRIQYAWHQWTFPAYVKYMWFDKTYIYVVHPFEGEDVISVINMQDNSPNEDISYNPRMDIRFIEEVDESNTIAWDREDMDFVFVVATGQYAGLQVGTYDAPVNGRLRLKAALAGESVFVGKQYECEYTPTRPFARDDNGRAMTFDALNILDYRMYLQETGELNVRVELPYVADPTNLTDRSNIMFDIPFDGRIVGSQYNRIGEVSLYTGELPIMVGMSAEDHSITIMKNKPTPMRIIDLEWSGTHTRRGQRL